jgi:hypothetical protein
MLVSNARGPETDQSSCALLAPAESRVSNLRVPQEPEVAVLGHLLGRHVRTLRLQ